MRESSQGMILAPILVKHVVMELVVLLSLTGLHQLRHPFEALSDAQCKTKLQSQTPLIMAKRYMGRKLRRVIHQHGASAECVAIVSCFPMA